MKTILGIILLAMLFSFGFAQDRTTVGQCATLDDTANETCTSVTFIEDWYGYTVIMPARGTRGSDGYMTDGWILNIGQSQDDPSSTYLYIIVHETDPRFDPEVGGNAGWGPAWQIFKLVDNTN